MEGSTLGISVSGGGYRATAWALGTVLGLVESGANARVSMISSVSGGSITNAAIGMSRTGFSEASADEFRGFATELAQRLAGRSRWFGMGLAVHLALAMSMWIFIGWSDWIVPAAVAVAMLVASAAAALSGDLLFGRVRTWIYLDFVLGAGGGALVLSWGHWWWFAAALVGLSVVLQLRGFVVGSALGASLRKLTGHPGRLRELNDDVVHVICATELRAGHHVYFSSRFVTAFGYGVGVHPKLAIHQAVQASANLPGAFPTRWMRSRRLGLHLGPAPPRLLALTDGGVYDNMGDQWVVGLPKRIERVREEMGRHPKDEEVEDVARLWESIKPNVAIVSNASGALQARKVWSSILPFIGEITGLLQVKDVLYDNGNSVRRSYLIDRFDRGKPPGTLVHIASNPYEFPNRAQTDGGAKAIAWLNMSGMTQGEWEGEPAFSRNVGTTLWPVGADRVNRLINHAYAETIANLLTREVIEEAPARPGLPWLLVSGESTER